jgi:murein DD-endopeptidase MepM/ murein hydrolase activator NlpD
MKFITILRKTLIEQAFATSNPDVDYTETSTGELISKSKKPTPTLSKAKSGEPVGKGNSKKVIDYFTSKGLEPHQAAGIAANFQAESGFNPSAIGDNGKSHGIAQWRDSRWESLQNFAKQKNKRWDDFNLQLDFAWQEMNDKYSDMLSDLKSAKTSDEATKVVMLQYEIPSDRSSSNIQKRQEIANSYYNTASSSSKGDTSVSNPFLYLPLSKSKMSKPEDTQVWGACRDKNCSRKHKGLDFEAAIGTPIYAPFGGVVSNVKNENTGRCGRGFTITTTMGSTTWSIRTCHCNDIYVSKAQEVKAGEVVGTVGGSGYGKDKNYGPHLHLELYKNGVVIDPTPYLSSSW